MIIKDGTKLNGLTVDSSTILGVGRVVSGKAINPVIITIHNTSNPNATADNHKNFLVNHNKKSATGAISSWHFTVDNLKVVQHLDTEKEAYHSATTKGNTTSIGVEVTEFTDATKQAKAIENAKILVRHLMNVHNITLANVVTHQHWSGKNCPRVILAQKGGFEAFKKTIPATITVNGATTVQNTAKASTAKATNTVYKPTFLATDKHIGVVEVVHNGNLNVRAKADLTSKVVKTTKKGETWKVYAITNGLYNIGTNTWVTSNTKYVKYFDNPFLDNNGKAIAQATKATVVTKRIRVLVDNLYTYKTADWDNKGKPVNKDDVFTVAKELTVAGAKMYQLKSGLFITASTKYVKVV